GNALKEFSILWRKHDVNAGSQNSDRTSLGSERSLMRRGVDPARPSTDDRHTDVSKLICELARDLQAVMRRLARTDHGHSVFIFFCELPFNVKNHRRIVNFAQQIGIAFVLLSHDVAAEILDALKFCSQINRTLPGGD